MYSEHLGLPMISDPTASSSPPATSLSPGVIPNQQKSSAFIEFFEDLAKVPKAFLADLAYRMNHLPQLNYELAQQLSGEGRMRDAVLRYRIALWLAPQHQLSWYYLGTCYLSLGQKDKALAAFAQAYKLDPNHAETMFMIVTIDPRILPPSKRPDGMPVSIAEDYFDRLASDYDRSQAALGYRAHIAAEAGLRALLEPNRVNYTLLDLGCGTGLAGAMLSPYCEQITGVDLSRGMLAQASERRRENKSPFYTTVYHQDLRVFLSNVSETFSLIIAVHVFNYLGEIDQVMKHAARALQPGGFFLAQVELYPEAGFGMLATYGRFGHSEEYMAKKALEAGLTIVAKESIAAYPNGLMHQYIFRKA